MIQGNQLSLIDLMQILNLGLQVYDIHLNKDEIEGTFERLKRIEEQNKEILSLLKKDKDAV